MKCAIDLHIHSALSPCADDDMTPNNIVNMAILKGLDIISITDHNSCDNVVAAIQVAGDNIVILPGMEVQTREEVHLLCYFKELEALLEFDLIIKNHMPHIPNDPYIFGNQYIMDEQDNIVGIREELLLVSVDMSVDEITEEVRRRGGEVVPAHVDRQSFSILSQLGFIPPDLKFSTLEIGSFHSLDRLNLKEYKYIISSDAHSLGQILEREMYVELDKPSRNDVLSLFRK